MNAVGHVIESGRLLASAATDDISDDRDLEVATADDGDRDRETARDGQGHLETEIDQGQSRLVIGRGRGLDRTTDDRDGEAIRKNAANRKSYRLNQLLEM